MEQEFTLPAGYLDKDGEIHKTVVLTPVTGRVRREIGDQGVRRSGNAILDKILIHCVKSIGTIEKLSKEILDNLLTGDRAYCALMIRKFRNESIRAEAQCGCGDSNLFEFNIDDYEIRELSEDDYQVEDLKGRLTRLFDVSCPSLGLESSFRYMTGSDERAIEGTLRRNPFEAQQALWRRCLIRWKYQETELSPPYPRMMFDNIMDNVLDFIDETFTKAQPGPEPVFYETCPSCGNDVGVTLENSDFFMSLPEATKRRYSHNLS